MAGKRYRKSQGKPGKRQKQWLESVRSIGLRKMAYLLAGGWWECTRRSYNHLYRGCRYDRSRICKEGKVRRVKAPWKEG
jgi:hypothetical protein